MSQDQAAACLQPCPACQRHTLACVSGGLPIRANPEQLTVNQEIAARLQGKETYDVITWGLPRKLYLEYRDLTRIKAGRKHPVVAEHPCGHMPRPAGPGDTELTFKTVRTETETPLF
jgi:hypothetical protein